MKSISKIFLSAGMSLCLISCVTLTQIPGRTSAPEAHTLPPGSEVLLATCQLSHPAAVWTEERTGYTVQRTVPFENAENFFQAALSNLPKIALGKISYRSTGSDRIAAFRSATNQDRIQNHFRPIAHHLPAFSLAGRTNAGQIAPVCMTPLGAHPQIGGATNVFFLALHGQIRHSEWVSVGLFQKPTFFIQPEMIIFLFDAAGKIVFLRRYDKEYPGLPRDARLSVATYYDSLARLLADRQKEIASDLGVLLENVETVKGENLETTFRKRAPGP